jgi:CheY-like chemotaxis protein
MTTKNVLIVDDEPKVAFFLGKGLERSGHNYNINVAQSGEEALDILDESEIDLLVTDLRMPGINGLELIRWVKATSPDTRTILITAYGNDDVEAEARRLEAYRYITKPFDIGDFTETVQQALGDVAVSQPGLTVLSDKTFDAITQRLDALRHDVGARCIFLADMQGQCLAQVGYTEGLKVSTLLALLAGGFATTGELARQFGDGEAANLNFHQGSRYEIYSSNVGDNLFISLLFDRQDQKSRIGLVWLFARRAIDDLLTTLSTAQDEGPAQRVGADFGAGVMSELDMMFGGEEDSDVAEEEAPLDRPQPAQAERPAPADFIKDLSAHCDEDDRTPAKPAAEATAAEKEPPVETKPASEQEKPDQKHTGAETAQDTVQSASEAVDDSQEDDLFSLEEAMALGLLPEGFEKDDEG